MRKRILAIAAAILALAATGILLECSPKKPANRLANQPDDAVSKIPIDPATWRLVQADVDNVYQDPAVSHLRNELMTKYATSMTQTDQMPSWADREAARKKAGLTLLEGMAQLRDMAGNAKSPLARQEASLAIMEIQYKLGDYKALAQARQTVPSLLTNEQLRVQADSYLIEGAQRQPDPEGAAALLRTLTEATPSLNQFYDVTTLRGCLRQVVINYEFAQGLDDLALQLPKMAAQLRLTQETEIVLANKYLDRWAPSVPRQKAPLRRDTTNGGK